MGQEATVLIPGLLCSPRLYTEQLPALWRYGPVTVAAHYSDDSVGAIADRILAAAPPRFALGGLSMGGYVAFEIMRRAAHRVTRLALIDTTARPDTAEQTRRRHDQIEMARRGRFKHIVDELAWHWVSPARRGDAALQRVIRQMADEIGVDGFVRQQVAILNRPDSRPDLGAIECPTLVVVGADDGLTTPAQAKEIVDGVGPARLVVVPECGHLSTLERPAVVTEALVDWLSW